MIVDDTSDIEFSTGFEFEYLSQELVGLLGIGLYTIFVHIEPVGGIERVFQELFELIDRANPVLHAVGGNGFRPAANVGDEILSPLFRSAVVTYGIIGGKFEHAFGEDVIDQILDMLLAFFVVNLGAIVEETAVALREGVLVQVVVPVYPCCLLYTSPSPRD